MPKPRSALEQHLERIESLVAQLEASSDPAAQAAAREMVRALLELHATGLAKILELLSQAGDGGQATLEACAHDELVGNLLLLHGLHPEGLE
jgi:hypothetical protein